MKEMDINYPFSDFIFAPDTNEAKGGTVYPYNYSIMTHGKPDIHAGKLEGITNQIKVMKRKAYGFNHLLYWVLLIIVANASNL